ncbi:MAG TPA: KOW domain-containing RNA-binding protein [Candidatus Limnocylindria bacterium]|nr:KOW domain-containing RNA-binding protein [Candidatus Limnocylindria bacterium]
MKPDLKGGIAAISLAGRDKGRAFMVLCPVDAQFVLVCDGRNRPVAKPKKKRRKHLMPTRHEMPELAAKYAQNRLRDEEIRAFLQTVRPSDDAPQPEYPA